MNKLKNFDESTVNYIGATMNILGCIALGAIDQAIEGTKNGNLTMAISGMATAYECGNDILAELVEKVDCMDTVEKVFDFIKDHEEEAMIVAQKVKWAMDMNPVVLAVRKYGKNLTLDRLVMANIELGIITNQIKEITDL